MLCNEHIYGHHQVRMYSSNLRNKLTFNHLTLNQNDATGHIQGINERNTFSKGIKNNFWTILHDILLESNGVFAKNVH